MLRGGLLALLLGVGCGETADPPAPEAPATAPAAPPPSVPPPANRTPGLPGTAGRQVPATPAASGAAPRAAAAGAPSSAADDPVVEHIRAVVMAGAPDVKRCFEQAITRKPGLGGRVAFEVSISAGRPTEVTVADDQVGDAAMNACIREVILAWRFGPSVNEDAYLPFSLNAS